MPKSDARPTAATTEEKYIRREAAGLLVFDCRQLITGRPKFLRKEDTRISER